MKKPLLIIAGEPNSICSEIICKSWIIKNKIKFTPFFVVGSATILKQQIKALNYKIKVIEINNILKTFKYFKRGIPVLNVNYKQKKPFEKVSAKSQKYLFKCFDKANELVLKRKVNGYINCPVSKDKFFNKKYNGVTEFLSKKFNLKNKETMLIYTKNFSVAPLTTHIDIKNVAKKITKKLIIRKVFNLSNSYKKMFNKKPKIAVLSLNPHGNKEIKNSEEKNIIFPALKILKNKKIHAFGPFPADSFFMKKIDFDIVVGMYHDQVLIPIKTLFESNAINITLGLPFTRVSPDHGIASDIVGKKLANPMSLIECLKFLSKKR